MVQSRNTHTQTDPLFRRFGPEKEEKMEANCTGTTQQHLPTEYHSTCEGHSQHISQPSQSSTDQVCEFPAFSKHSKTQDLLR